MDERTRAATYEDVKRVAELLESEGVEYALIGGYALALQGIVRTTEDVDVLVELSVENARRWVRALAKLPDGAAKDVLNSASGFSWDELAPYRKRLDGINVVSLEVS